MIKRVKLSMKQNLITVCYPIKPIYSEKIMNGQKKYELRKRLPNSEIDYILIYSTTPVAKVVGYAEVKKTHVKPVHDMWIMVSPLAGISKEDYMSYFDGKENAYAIELKNVWRFKSPFDIKEINKNFTVPQSFCYVSEEDFKRLKRRRVEHV
jgi:predicted transcriptional regulator